MARYLQHVTIDFGLSIRAAIGSGGLLERSEGITASLTTMGSVSVLGSRSTCVPGVFRVCRGLCVHGFC